MVVELIKYDDSLREGTDKINKAIQQANNAEINSTEAKNKAVEALEQANDTQTQLDTIVINGDSSVEAAQARVSTNNEGETTSYTVLKERLDTEHNKLQQDIGNINELLLETAVDLKRFGATGDGITDDTLAIQQAIDFAYSEGRAIKGENNTYLVSSIILKPNVYFLKGVTFCSSGLLTGNSYVVSCEQGVFVDEINVVVPSESTEERIIQVVSDCSIDSIKISSDTQKNMFNDLLDGALMISGSNITVGSINISNFDYAVNIYNSTNTHINQIRCNSFVRGVYVRKSKNCSFNIITTEVKSPNTTQSPGHNSLLIEECESITFNSLNLSDAGEHAVRIGGIRDGSYLQKYLTFGNITTRRSGQCGFKAYTGDTNRISYIHVDNLTVIDCSYQNVPGENEDGLYLVGVDFAYIGNYRCVKELNGVSAYRGVYISSTNKVTIDNTEIWQTQSTGITVDDAYGRVNDLHINTCTIRQVKAECILVDHDGFELRDIIFKNMYLREYGASNYGIKINVVSVYSPVLFDGYINTTGTLGAFQSITSNGLIFNKMVVINAP